MPRPLVRIVLLLLVAGGAAAAWFLWLAPRDAGAAGLVLYGNVDIRQVELGFRAEGRVAAMLVDEGEAVAAGDVLAKLDTGPLEDEVAMREADLAAAEAALAELDAGARPEEIARAEAELRLTQATLANAQRVFARVENLLGSNAVSQQSYDEAKATRDEAAARLQAAQASLDLVEAGARQEEIDAARAQRDGAAARLVAARRSLEDATLTAPDAGIVLARVREPGAIVTAGATIYTVSLTRPVQVRAYVSEPHLGEVAPGTLVSLWTDGDPDRRYAGRIGFVSPVAEFTPRSVETPDLRDDLVYRLRITVEDPDTGLLQGMPVSIALAGPS